MFISDWGETERGEIMRPERKDYEAGKNIGSAVQTSGTRYPWKKTRDVLCD